MSIGYGYQKPETQRYCPDHPNEPMQKVNDRGVILDKCRCGIIVLDPGELETIIAAVTTMSGFSAQRFQTRQAQHGGHHGGHHHRSSGGVFDMFFSS